MYSIVKYRLIHSIKESLNKYEVETIAVDSEIKKTIISSPAQLMEIISILQSGLQKLKISLMISFDTSLAQFIVYNQEYVSPVDGNIRGPTGLALDYYNKQGGYYRNAQFLYGTASQFR